MELKDTTFFTILLFGLYFPLLGSLSALIIYKLKLLFFYVYYNKNVPVPQGTFNELPFVTIQLPLYNEPNVVERLLGSAVALAYPKNRFEIQILDDSTDETVAIASGLVEKYKAEGFNIDHIRRKIRKDFKAGALAEGLKIARGEYVAIFDSDFIIPENFLTETVHFFTDAKVGMVQARWGYINANHSLLTRLQSTFLNGHFIIEHTSRNRSGLFFNFNGTAGIWRKKAIFEAGGWQGDTLTEDLDLSYRAQVSKWKFVFLKDLICYSELPPTLDAFNGQQYRWVKGMCEVLFKVLPVIWKAPVSLRNKVDATLNLGSGLGYIFSVLITLCAIPVLFLAKEYLDIHYMYLTLTFIFINCIMIWFYYFIAEAGVRGYKLKTFLYPLLLVIFSIGLSLNGLIAVIDAVRGKRTAFIRTPKFNDNLRAAVRADRALKPFHYLVFLFVAYFITIFTLIMSSGKFALLPAFLFFAPSYFWLIFRTLREKILVRSN